MKTVNDLLSNQPIIDGISLVISVIVPLLVMFLTFRFERNKSDREIKEREEQFDLELNNSKAQHEDTMRMQKRAEMAKILPFLNLENDVDIYYDKEKKRISLKIKNIGNGIAMDVQLLECSMMKHDDIGYLCVYKRDLAETVVYYRCIENLSKNVLSVNESATFILLIDIFNREKGSLEINDAFAHNIDFSIKYKDSFYNEYKQNYRVQFSYSLGVGRIYSGLPELIEE